MNFITRFLIAAGVYLIMELLHAPHWAIFAVLFLAYWIDVRGAPHKTEGAR